MKRRLLCLLGITGLGLSSSLVMVWNAFPRSLLNQTVACPTNRAVLASGVQILETQYWQGGMIALYSAVCPKNPKGETQRVLGYKILRREGMNWLVEGSDGHAVTFVPSSTKHLAEYEVSYPTDATQKRYTVLYGQVFSSRVAAIEATFDDGQVVRELTLSGVFALVLPKPAIVCEVRMLGVDNQILGVNEHLVSHRFAHFRRHQRCLPASQQL